MEWSEELCSGCGACAAACPNKAISMRFDSKKSFFVPEFDLKKCTDCGNCLEVCPLQSFTVSGKPLGESIACFRGHASDRKLRKSASSGGVVSALSIFLLEKKLVDGVLSARMNPAKPLEAEFFLATSAREVKTAKGSKYSPTTFSPALEKALAKGKKIAFVGLPCQVKGLKQLMERKPKAKKLVKYAVGVFCSHMTSRAGTKFFLEREGIPLEEVKGIAYRGNGWPGGMTVSAKGKEFFFPLEHYLDNFFGSYFFGLKSCLFCYDQTAEFADISVGDGYFGDTRPKGLGESAVIARTKKGLELIEKAVRYGIIEAKRIDKKEIEFVQRKALSFKKEKILARIKVHKSKGKPVPMAKASSANGLMKGGFGFWLLSQNIELSRKPWFRTLLKRLPIPLVKAYKVLVFSIAFR